MPNLFDPITIGKVTLTNRLVMAPMTRNRAATDGSATSLMAEYYSQRASAGLIITESIQPSAVGKGFIDTPGLHHPDHATSWRTVTDAVHVAGGRIVAQLMHSGRIGHPDLYPTRHQSVAPSPVTAAGQAFSPQGPLDYQVPHELTLNEITATVTDFALSARLAIEAGFDGVELHAGNGFLLHQFLADGTNRRSDAYGGSIAARIRFPVEVVEAVADVIGPERLGLRISPGNPYNDMAESDTDQLYAALLRSLPSMAYLHIMEAGTRAQTLALREQWDGALILNPHADADAPPVNPQIAQQVLDDGLTDAVCLGAMFLANPDLPERIRLGGPYNEPDPATIYGGDERGYTDYPTLEPQ